MKEFVKKVSSKISKLSSEQLRQVIDSITEENDVLNSIMDSLSTGLIIVDSDWCLMQTNIAAERLIPFKIRPNDIKTEKPAIWDIINDEYIIKFLKEYSISPKVNSEEEFSMQTDSGNRFITMSIVPLVLKNWKEANYSSEVKSSISGSIITVDDITEKKQQEILLHRMESLASLTNLAASVAHEIKNPLGAISIHIQLLQRAVKKARDGDGTLPKEKFMEGYISVINEEIDNLNKIVLDFLFAVRPVQADMTLCDPDVLLSRFVEFFKPEFDSKNVRVTLNLCNSGKKLLMDEKLFREVMVNLTQNALSAILDRFPLKDSKQNILSAEKISRGELVIESCIKNDRYSLTVADNGSGMDEKTAGRIFEPYYTTKADGTGLGLTTVYKIIKEFRGDIDVKSVPWHGTAFMISIPIHQNGMKLLEAQEN